MHCFSLLNEAHITLNFMDVQMQRTLRSFCNCFYYHCTLLAWESNRASCVLITCLLKCIKSQEMMMFPVKSVSEEK